jgi:hypothetical protein
VFELKADAIETFCRGCIKKWHGIENDRVFSEAEVDFIVALILGWIKQR